MKVQIITLILLSGFLTMVLVGYYLNLHLFVVTSNSMQPTFSYGDVLFAKSQEHYYLKDIISYKINDAVVTHRIKSIYTTFDGVKEYIQYQTKGDANKVTDQIFVQKNTVVGKTILVVPMLGFIILFVQSKIVTMIMLIFILFKFSTLVFNTMRRKKGRYVA